MHTLATSRHDPGVNLLHPQEDEGNLVMAVWRPENTELRQPAHSHNIKLEKRKIFLLDYTFSFLDSHLRHQNTKVKNTSKLSHNISKQSLLPEVEFYQAVIN